MKTSVCFFAKVQDRQTLERVEFYAQDIQILRDLGFDVRIAITPGQIRRADFYYVWWWTWAFFPLAAAKLFRRPILITGVFDTPSMPQRSILHRRLITGALKAADANVFLSNDEMIEIPGTYEVARPRLVHLAVDVDAYRPGGARESFVLSVGWLEGGNAIRKCMPEIIRAAPLVKRAHPEVKFLIGGVKGTYFPVLEALAREVGASSFVEFLGELPKATKIDLMQRCQVYLQPSRLEGFGLAILEAMSCGAPVVTSPVGAVPEVVGDTAVLVDGTSVEQIAAAVIGLLDDEHRRRDAGQRARQRAETLFSYSRRREELGKVIEGTLGRR
jgi:glycosyltransferase involved in cell wall biosynthesis